MKQVLKYLFAVLILIVGAVVVIFWTPDIPRHELVNKYATGASDFIELPSGAYAHYRKQGNENGETLVLIHGSNSSLHAWEDWVEILSSDYLIYTVDLPGHGLTGPTPADSYTYGAFVNFLREFKAAMNIDKFIIGGSSMGGGTSLQYALMYPQDLKALVLVDPAGISAPEGSKVDRPLAFELAGRWYTDWILLNITPRSIVEEGLKKGFVDQSKITEEMIDRYWELARLPGNRAATSKRFGSYRENRGDLPVSKINLPTLLLWGEKDLLIPVEAGIEMHKRMPNSTLITFDSVGHVPMEEIPEESARIAKEFIESLNN
ncbi:alpha/beta fold hydrolase [Kordiimonas laminariae]|uniref:alpha/beta fold hydrolase n=1 Tax=Kordiimonas laminariae TaxID=2917717 RepID=UPI001FF1A7A9|nr:alpha/beta hydrolase [Kordiimonas laminariae]MCK0069724.1 alpha/beta hydrolase [Kordiimonas laminariae]